MTSDDLIDEWIRPEIRSLTAYHVPDAAGLIKLDAMENPYGWPPAMVEDWLARLRGAAINRYPDPRAHALTARLRTAMGIPEGMEVVLGNGSDELIQMVLTAVAAPGRSILAPEPTFVMYRLLALAAGLRYVGVPLSEDAFALDREAMLTAIRSHRPAVVFIAYPNNPTGNLFGAEDIEAIVRAAPGLVVVDEAYHPFAGASFMEALGAFPNLLVMRTVSKLGLAGLRLGILAGPPAWLAQIDKVRLPYNINVLTQLSAEFALGYGRVLDEQTGQIRADRARLMQAMERIAGVRVYPSDANFVLFRVPDRATQVFEGLKARRVLIKNLHPAGGPLAHCLRVTVGRPEENAAFITALTEILASA